jgi:NAD(P)-dependent dehydrogenase (short-subunit alcohol dehydrogenase family)
VVTGGSAGVGRATAREFARGGDSVAVLARGSDGLQATVKEIEAAGSRALAVPVDVARVADIDQAAERIEVELGPVDIWVNNAMATVFAPFKEITPEEFKRATEVTYLGSVYATKAALDRMLARDRGVIVQVGSALAYRGIPLQSAYCGAKHALQGFVESIRCELLHDRSNVRITSVHLPALNTPQFNWSETRLPNKPQPVPPIYQPEVAARGIVWAADHPQRREHWVGGTTVATILANYVAPGLLDRYLARTKYRAQQRDEPVRPDRPSNLWEPVEGDFGAHGDFGERAHERSYGRWLAEHRSWIGLGGMLAVAGALAGKRGG